MAAPSDLPIHIDDPWFGYIKEGRKTVEGKIAKGKALKMIVGCNLEISGNSGAVIRAQVTAVRRYGSFREYLSTEGLETTLPGITSINEGLAVYHKYYAPGIDAQLGVLAVEMMVIA